ncbi:uncharacterized skeletal organic matrix protein 2-like [Haliotis rubra]|uniref:uncharacterized skeletal organic matrix protein 2-like n=1 Tax=Haliotis rubra TaxID=36100 RepID=UPI001EE5BDA4|nr:uncharacterized skeletal organic matrix protein 2-like [Haliotis rubra]
MLPVLVCLVLLLPGSTNSLPSINSRENRQLQAGPHCYSCQGVRQPYDCNVTVTCQPHEQCFTDEYSTTDGRIIFTVGCRPVVACNSALDRRSEVKTRNGPSLKCEECCHGDHCNSGGCSAGPPKGNRCYHCDFIDDPTTCATTTICKANQHCFVDKVYTDNYETKYNLGCADYSECYVKGGTKRDNVLSTMCSVCCDGNYCNHDCQNPVLARCFSCLGVDHPYNCNVTVECRPGEQCYLDEYMTAGRTTIYNAGCRAVSICDAKLGHVSQRKRAYPTLKCEECCHSNYCNKGGCGAEPAKGTVCYNCDFVSDPRLCYKTTTCRSTQVNKSQKIHSMLLLL